MKVLSYTVGLKAILVVFSYNASLCGLPQQSSECDDRRHAGTVEEEERSHTLQADGIRVVR